MTGNGGHTSPVLLVDCCRLTQSGKAGRQKTQVFVHPVPSLSREFEDRHAGTNGLDVAVRRMPVEFYGARQVHLRDYRHVSTVENCWVLQGLVLALGHGNQHEPQIFAQVVGRRTNQVSNILDEKKIQIMQIPSFQCVLNHGGFKMTECPGGDLLDRGLTARQPDSVVFRSEISHEGGDAITLTKPRESFFQEHGFAGTWAGDEAYHKNSCCAELLAQCPSRHIILLKDVFPDFD